MKKNPLKFARYFHSRIGLLGGSFNPPHAGHVYISEQALKRLGLDAVWWLVSPQNPLKTSDDMADYRARVTACEKLTAHHPRLLVSEFETQNSTQFTFDTIRKLQTCFPETEFVWLMGTDNLVTLHRWQKWRELLGLIPTAIFPRDPLPPMEKLHNPMASRAALAYAPARLADTKFLGHQKPPAWLYLPMRKHPASATALRKSGKGL